MNKEPLGQAYPLAVYLPEGTAHLVKTVLGIPVYAMNGVRLKRFDVRIPGDLAASWFWFGSFLSSIRWPISISTGTYGLPKVFEIARRHDAKILELRDSREREAAAKAAKSKKTSRAPKPRKARPVSKTPDGPRGSGAAAQTAAPDAPAPPASPEPALNQSTLW